MSAPRPDVRDLGAGDRPVVDTVLAAALGDDEGPTIVRLVDRLRATDAMRAELVAVEDDEVVGHVALSRSWLDTRRALVEVLVLSPLSVRPDRQGSGVGTTLLAAAVGRAEALGSPAVFLEGAPDYYAARGWRPARDHGFEAPSSRIPGPAFQVVLLPGREEWMTGRLVYAEAFWALDSVGLRDPFLAEVEAALGVDGVGEQTTP